MDLTDYYLSIINEAHKKISALLQEVNFTPLPDAELSRKIFRDAFDARNPAIVLAHAQAIVSQVDYLRSMSESLLDRKGLYFELAKDICRFCALTNIVKLDNQVSADDSFRSQDLYLAARKTFIPLTMQPYSGNLRFNLIAMDLRVAIEVYFKNMIGFVAALGRPKKLSFKRKTKGAQPYKDEALSIAKLLSFFEHKQYSKYAKLPVAISIIKDINFWSNSIIHTGIMNFGWQSLVAVNMLDPLFYTARPEGGRSIYGYNYLNLDYEHEDLNKDLNKFFSDEFTDVTVYLRKRGSKPIEGDYYYRKT